MGYCWRRYFGTYRRVSSKDIEDIERATMHQVKYSLWMHHRVGMITVSVAYGVYTRVKTLTTKIVPHDPRPLLKGGATILRLKAYASRHFYMVYRVPKDRGNISFIKKCCDSAA